MVATHPLGNRGAGVGLWGGWGSNQSFVAILSTDRQEVRRYALSSCRIIFCSRRFVTQCMTTLLERHQVRSIICSSSLLAHGTVRILQHLRCRFSFVLWYESIVFCPPPASGETSGPRLLRISWTANWSIPSSVVTIFPTFTGRLGNRFFLCFFP
jgi:hypothetical protein